MVSFIPLQFSHSVRSDSLWPHGLQHARPLCPSLTPGAFSNSSIELVMPCNHLILCRPLLLPPSIFPSIRVFSNESLLCIRWTKYFHWKHGRHLPTSFTIEEDWTEISKDSLNLHSAGSFIFLTWGPTEIFFVSLGFRRPKMLLAQVQSESIFS